MPPVPEPKQPVLQELAPEPLACVQGATTLPALDAKAVAELAEGWLPAVEAPVDDETVQAIDVVKAIADAVKESDRDAEDAEDAENVEDTEDDNDVQDESQQRKKKTADKTPRARPKRERTPEETQPTSTPSTPSNEDDNEETDNSSPCKRPKNTSERPDMQEQRGSDLAVVM